MENDCGNFGRYFIMYSLEKSLEHCSKLSVPKRDCVRHYCQYWPIGKGAKQLVIHFQYLKIEVWGGNGE